jgi:hypothetical protein
MVLPSQIVEGENTGLIKVRSYYDIDYDDIFHNGITVGRGDSTIGFEWVTGNFPFTDQSLSLDTHHTFIKTKPIRTPDTGLETNNPLKLRM